MKKTFQKLFLSTMIWILLATSTFCSSLNAIEEAYYLRYKVILETMKNEIEQAPKTGNVDKDFLYEVIPHFQAAIAMSENILQYGRHPEVIQIAKRIIEEEETGLQSMKDLLMLLLTTNQQSPYFEENKHVHEDMIVKMEALKPTGNVDKDFLEQMIIHHEGGIAMANNVLESSGYLIVRAVAQDMIRVLSEEVTQMKELYTRIK